VIFTPSQRTLLRMFRDRCTLVEQALRHFPLGSHCPLVVVSFGSRLLFQDFCTTQVLL
jgi:hypothetical protein